MPSRNPSALRALLTFLATCASFVTLALYLHYDLPTPLVDLTDPLTGLPQISEKAILDDAQYLSETIGYRTVGTREHALGDIWMLEKANALKRECERLVKTSSPKRYLECEVFRQSGNGTHRFDMMDRRVYKNYVNLSNIIFRLSNGTDEGKEHAVVVNAHVDSTLPSPGAADDAVPCAIMLDSIRVLINTPTWTPQHAIIFLWNNAEESLQDGSHLFSTQSPLISSARAVINLEAAGVSGPEILFQATSEEIIEAYSQVPRPFGTSLANDVFASGLILSDTDFRQFEEYGNLTGLDMAIVGDSYLYHTQKDLVRNIQPGVAQHMGENVLALLRHLTSSVSPLPRLKTFTKPRVVFMSVLGHGFLSWSYKTAEVMYNTGLALSLVLIYLSTPKQHLSLRINLSAIVGVVGGLLGAIVSTNVVALLMDRVLGKSMTWFSRTWLPIGLYGAPALFGLLGIQVLAKSILPITHRPRLEYNTMVVYHLLMSTIAAVIQTVFEIGSSGAGFIWSLSTGTALVFQYFSGNTNNVSPWVYAIAQIIPAAIGTDISTGLLDIFVPLTGRTGEAAPSEHIVATIVAVLLWLTFPLVMPLSQRFSRKSVSSFMLLLLVASFAAVGIFSSNLFASFDDLHPRRLFVVHSEDINTGELALHISTADSAPGLPLLVEKIAQVFNPAINVSDLLPIAMDEWNADWDITYPFSQFLTPFKIPLSPAPRSYTSPWTTTKKFTLRAENDEWDSTAGTRSFTLVIDHPGLIWTVVAFDAHVLKWSLDENPLPFRARHHVKEASFYGTDRWTLDLVLAANESSQTGTKREKPTISIDFQGLQERGMWPGKKNEAEGLAMDLFASLHPWLDSLEGASYDAMLMGCVIGKVVI